MTEPKAVDVPEESVASAGSGETGLMVLRPAVLRVIAMFVVAWFLLATANSYLAYTYPGEQWLKHIFWALGMSLVWLVYMVLWLWIPSVLVVGFDRLSQFCHAGGRLGAPVVVLKFGDVGEIAVRRSPLAVITRLGTLEITYREGCQPIPKYRSQKVSPVAVRFSGLVLPHVVAKHIWERVSAHNEAAGLPLPKLNL